MLNAGASPCVVSALPQWEHRSADPDEWLFPQREQLLAGPGRSTAQPEAGLMPGSAAVVAGASLASAAALRSSEQLESEMVEENQWKTRPSPVGKLRLESHMRLFGPLSVALPQNTTAWRVYFEEVALSLLLLSAASEAGETPATAAALASPEPGFWLSGTPRCGSALTTRGSSCIERLPPGGPVQKAAVGALAAAVQLMAGEGVLWQQPHPRVYKMVGSEELRNMVSSFRFLNYNEQPLFLGFAGQNKTIALQFKLKFENYIDTSTHELLKDLLIYPRSGLQFSVWMVVFHFCDISHSPSFPVGSVLLQDTKPMLEMQQPCPPIPPTHPDVQLKNLPFYDELDVLIEPTSLVQRSIERSQEELFSFTLTRLQVTEIRISRVHLPDGGKDYRVQVQLRLCLAETSCPQKDGYLNNLSIEVNGKLVPHLSTHHHDHFLMKRFNRGALDTL
ncbi:hypothetical protein QTO34_004027 [Cnephaeus nilssonii]|uniref:PINIT domain-containing protein n=1 Tax=Cnephaeus nilssonii TaxID=3371016 RepID=A0AA40LLS8_CNENI|nr:hypothetical protein QTO34_004027 [Eptesicus nilssonii]